MIKWDGIVSLLIACLEIVLLVNLIIFAEKNRLNKIVISLVILLAFYQILEFLICYFGIDEPAVVYLAFAVISLLPPLNLLFSFKYFGYDKKNLALLFIPAMFFIIYYGFVVDKFHVVKCGVLYASYNYPLGSIYGFFYYVPVLISIYLFGTCIKKLTGKKNKLNARVILTGLIVITVPVLFAFALSIFNRQDLLQIIESIMCKFAFVYALCLSFFSLNYRVDKK